MNDEVRRQFLPEARAYEPLAHKVGHDGKEDDKEIASQPVTDHEEISGPLIRSSSGGFEDKKHICGSKADEENAGYKA